MSDAYEHHKHSHPQKQDAPAMISDTALAAGTNSHSTQLKRHQAVMDKWAKNKGIDSINNNSQGLPKQLKQGVEALSGYAMDDVVVHRNSSTPAQLHAHAFAQGNDIHLAPGQEQHLPHEAWHVAQQKQGRVNPTRQLKGKVAINDDSELEREADVMGERAMQIGRTGAPQATQLKTATLSTATTQCALKYDQPIQSADIDNIEQMGGKLVFKVTGHVQDAIIVKAESIAGGETMAAFTARNRAIDIMGNGVLPNMPDAKRLTPNDIEALQACNLPNNQALELLHNVLGVDDRDTTLLLLKKECKDVGSQNMKDITTFDRQNAEAKANAGRIEKAKEKVSKALHGTKTRSQLLLEDESIMLSLGTCAAFDLFIGNEDRFTPHDVNLENIDFDTGLKQVVALDQLNPNSPIVHIQNGAVDWEGEATLVNRDTRYHYADSMYKQMLSSAGLSYKSAKHDTKIQAFAAGMDSAILKLIAKKDRLKIKTKRRKNTRKLNEEEKQIRRILTERIERLEGE